MFSMHKNSFVDCFAKSLNNFSVKVLIHYLTLISLVELCFLGFEEGAKVVWYNFRADSIKIELV